MWSEIGTNGQEKSQTFIEIARRRQIVEATIEALADVGYGKASLALIAMRAGISKGVISYHFNGKANLMAQVESGIVASVEQAVRPAVEAQTTAGGMLHAFIRTYLEYMRDHRAQLIALTEIFFMKARDVDRTPAYDSMDVEPVLHAFADILAHGQDTGEFRQFDARVVAVSLWGVIEGVSTQWTAHPDLDLDHYIAEVVALVDRATRRER